MIAKWLQLLHIFGTECHAFLIHKLQDIDPKTGYEEFKRKRGTDPRFEALDRKERVALFKEK